MGDSLTACAAALVNRLVAFVATQPVSLPVLKDQNVETGQAPPTGGYIQCWPFEDLGEAKTASGGAQHSTFTSTWHWGLTVCIPRNSGEGLASDLGEAIKGDFRQLQLGDLNVLAMDVVPLQKQPQDPYYQCQVLFRGEKISDYPAAVA